MARVLSTAFCVALLAATAGAFALTQGAKVELSPIYATSIPLKVFSPTCRCSTDKAPISFRLRESEHIEVWMERDGTRAETLVPGRTFAKGSRVSLSFDGVADDGLTLPDGGYRPVVRLPHRTFTLPNTIVIDTKPPSVVRIHRRYDTHISPDGDHHDDLFRVHYVLSEKAHALLYVDGHRVERTREAKAGFLQWDGRIGGRVVPTGKYVLTVSAQDTAGNLSKPLPFAVVTVRYVVLGRTRIVVRPGARFAILVLADAPHVETLFNGGRREFATRRGHVTVRLRAPSATGAYRLYVTASGHAARALVVVG